MPAVSAVVSSARSCHAVCIAFQSGHDETGPPNAISAFDCRRCRAAGRHTKRRYRRRSMRRRWIWPGCEKKEIQRAPLEQLTEPGTHTRLGLASPPSIQKEEPMNRFGVLSLCAVTGLGLALLSDIALGQQKSLKEQMVGSWTYVSADTIAPDGKRTPTFGPNPAGLTIFGSDGRYVSLVVRNDVPKFAANSRAAGTAEENKAAVLGG